MLAKIKIVPPGRGLLVTKHIVKLPENRHTPFEPAAGCAPSRQRVDAKNAYNRIDGPHVLRDCKREEILAVQHV